MEILELTFLSIFLLIARFLPVTDRKGYEDRSCGASPATPGVGPTDSKASADLFKAKCNPTLQKEKTLEVKDLRIVRFRLIENFEIGR
jgi:hypothetical protein